MLGPSGSRLAPLHASTSQTTVCDKLSVVKGISLWFTRCELRAGFSVWACGSCRVPRDLKSFQPRKAAQVNYFLRPSNHHNRC